MVAVITGLVLPVGAAQIDGRDKWKADTRAAIPKLAKPPVCDGRIAPGEWDGAFQYDGVLYPLTMNLFPRSVRWYVGWDADFLYLASRTVRLEGETPRQDADSEDVSKLSEDDSLEVFVSSADRRAWLHLVVNPGGKTAFKIRPIGGKPIEGAPKPAAAASLSDEQLDYEVRIPVAALGMDRPNRAGDRWGILPVRDFRTGTNVQAPMPYAFYGGLGDPAKIPVFLLSEGSPFVRFDSPRQGLYAGRVAADVKAVNPAADARQVTVALSVHGEKGERYAKRRDLAVAAGKTARFHLDAAADPPIDPAVETEYRYALTVTTADGSEIFHTHFTWAPTENRNWLGAKLPEPPRLRRRVLTLDPRGPIPFAFQRFLDVYKDLPEGHKVRVTALRGVEPGKGYVRDSILYATPVDAAGQKDGVETFYVDGYLMMHTITWRRGQRHGPEKFYGVAAGQGRYLKTLIPWVQGVVQGTRKVFHPSGEAMVTVEYDGGRAVGVGRRQDEQGRLIRTTPFVDGVRDGVVIDYYPRTVRRVTPYVEGVVHGVVREYDQRGREVHRCPYRNAVRHGVEMILDPSGDESKTQRRYWFDGETVSQQRYEARGGQAPAGAKEQR